jgi:hypothetical protein
MRTSRGIDKNGKMEKMARGQKRQEKNITKNLSPAQLAR